MTSSLLRAQFFLIWALRHCSPAGIGLRVCLSVCLSVPGMKSDRSEWLCVIVLLLQQTSVSGSERFEVLGPRYPIAVYPGEDTVLPCYLSPNISAEDMQIRWFREDPTAPVSLYQFGQYNFQKQIPSYKGRAELFPEEFRKGNVSLRLKDVRGSDDGRYNCMVLSADSYEEALIDVVVRGQSSVSLHSEGGQTRLECRSDRYPEPAVIWTDRDGQDVTSLSNTTEQRDSERRLSLRSSIPVRQESNVFSCLIRSAVSEPNWEPQLHILKKETLFESQVLPVLRSHLDEEYQWTFNVRHGRWADVTLDPDTAHCALTLSEDGKRVRRGDRQDLPDNQQRFDYRPCVVSRESFTSGRHYWVLEVNGWWRIGVTSESANRRGDFSFTPQRGYWCLDCVSSSLSALTDPRTRLPQTLCPRMLGVCVDIEERRVSFYTVESRAHIYTFTDMRFPEGQKIYPFFWTGDRNRDLVILPPVETETGHS
ncbi:butyrophilin subfamily 1 member A1 isoform X2 [Amia ocellicauda]|uniref:butyrophilin subfamily 1 member A1 isoform X2 n=1 Tax=Amia ocellicauda TaxID=2972642 RepID=UPI003464596C